MGREGGRPCDDRLPRTAKLPGLLGLDEAKAGFSCYQCWGQQQP